MAVIGACTAFGAICGSSVATTATFGRAALPELRRYGYDAGFATGTIAVGGTLGILIPPSVILVVYAITTEQNIAKLFKAALIPGLMAALFYCLAIAWSVRRRPGAGAAGAARASADRLQALLPRLAGAADRARWWSAASMAASSRRPRAPRSAPSPCCWSACCSGTLGWRGIIDEPASRPPRPPAMIFIILLGAEVFNAFLALSQVPDAGGRMGRRRSGLPPYGVLVALLALYIVLGAVMDELAMILLTLPVFFPIVHGARFRPAGRRGGDLVRHPGADRGRHRADGAADRAQRVRGQRRSRATCRSPRSIAACCRSSARTSSGSAWCVAFPGLALWLVRLLS